MSYLRKALARRLLTLAYRLDHNHVTMPATCSTCETDKPRYIATPTPCPQCEAEWMTRDGA